MISRRYFLKGLGVTVGLMYSGMSSLAHATYERTHIFMTDFGGLIKKPIKGFTDSSDEAQKIIKSKGLVHPRGTGHSNMGQSIRKNATIFTPEPFDIVFDEEHETVYASAGSTLLDIDNYLEQFGYMTPTTPDHRAVSLGGVLSVGGYGVEVCRYGALVDNVVSVDLMYDDGRIVRNLLASHPATKQVLCAVGEYAIILAAKIKCVRRPIYSYLKTVDIKDVDHYLEKCMEYIEDPDRDEKTDIWYAYWGSGTQGMSYGKMIHPENEGWVPPEDGYEKYDDYRAYRKERSDKWSFGKPYAYHVWLDHFFTPDTFKAGAERALEDCEQIRKDGGEVILYSSLGPTNKEIEHFPHYADSDYLISVGIFANFLEGQELAAKRCARRHMAYSKEMQDKYNARVYRYAWQWQDGFKI